MPMTAPRNREKTPKWTAHLEAVAPALVVAALSYRGALATFFAQDDIRFLSWAAGLERPDWAYRPLSAGLAFRAQSALFGLHPLGYHVVNLLLHLLNVVGVYFLSLRLGSPRRTAGAAALLFGVSAIAFTPLHWASGVIELLTGLLVLAATLIHLASADGERPAWRWLAAAVGLAAVLSKETALAWLLVIVLVEWRRGPRVRMWRGVAPALATTSAALVLLLAGRGWQVRVTEAYALTAAPLALLRNLCTYLWWCVALHEPIRDVVALPDPRAWRVALPLALAAVVVLWRARASRDRAVEVGLVWWLAFLLPVVPLVHHTYLYYLYVPWMGGAIAAAALGQAALARLGHRVAPIAGLACLAAFALVEARNVQVRERATRDALPVDRTMRDAVLLRHSLGALARAHLPPGSAVLFVNPVPRARFDLMTGAPTRSEDLPDRASYRPLEAAMRGGETLRLFLPGLAYLGFADTIPAGREAAECFYYEQRGWLEDLGSGPRALLRQGGIQLAARSWDAADASFRRARALGDSVPAALAGQLAALRGAGRVDEARGVAAEYLRRWPDGPDAAPARELLTGARAGGR